MKRTVSRATRLRGEVRVPGEFGPAIRALWLAAVSEGTSRIDHVPPAAAATVALLERLGIGAACDNGSVRVDGRGLRGLEPADGVIDLDGPEEAVLPALAILARQTFPSRVRVAGSVRAQATQLLQLLACGGAVGTEEGEDVLSLEGAKTPAGADHEETDLSASVKLGLLTAGLYGDGPTVVRESPPSSRDRIDAMWKDRGDSIEASRQGEPLVRVMTVSPDSAPEALDVDVAGDLTLALPFVTAALAVRRADVTIRRVMIRPENRLFIDLVRQLGAEVEFVDGDDGSTDLVIKGSANLKATRVAEKRAGRLLDQVALLAVLATQTEGEFIIRDIESLREGDYDFVDHLVDLLRRVDAKVGEYPEGIVIEGGRPLKGDRIDSRRHAGVVQAFAVAGLVAHGDMEIEDAQCVDESFPGFFDLLDGLQAAKAMTKESA